MRYRLRTLALLLLALSFTACPRRTDEAVTSFVLEAPADPTPTPTPYEDPADCRCYVINGKTVCNSACPPGVKRF